MYILNLPYSLLVSASMIVGYAIYMTVDAWRIIVWIIGTLMIQLTAMVLASILSALIAGIGTRFKFKKPILNDWDWGFSADIYLV